MEVGIKVTVEEDIRWKFCHIKSLNLLPNIMIKNKINEQGYQEAILVRDGVVTEGCHSNFFIVKNDKLITHPADHFILHGITRHYVITLAKELHIEVEEREFSLQEVYEADECFLQRHHSKYSRLFKLAMNSLLAAKEDQLRKNYNLHMKKVLVCLK